MSKYFQISVAKTGTFPRRQKAPHHPLCRYPWAALQFPGCNSGGDGWSRGQTWEAATFPDHYPSCREVVAYKVVDVRGVFQF
jgi:hypothetical protein